MSHTDLDIPGADSTCFVPYLGPPLDKGAKKRQEAHVARCLCDRLAKDERIRAEVIDPSDHVLEIDGETVDAVLRVEGRIVAVEMLAYAPPSETYTL